LIISAAPFRISFAGGGSDLPVFWRRRRGAVLSATIDKHVYITVHPYFNRSQTLLKYSANELVGSVGEIRHPILRECLRALWPQGGLEVVSTADVPSGTGLGSSSAFTVALLNALHALRGEFRRREELAREACEVEIERLGEPIGKQDQYAAACGGLNLIEFDPSGSVRVEPAVLSQTVLSDLEESFLLFFTGDQRETRSILSDQALQVGGDEEKFRSLERMVDLAYSMRERLAAGDVVGFGADLHEGWTLKRTLSARISNDRVEGLYAAARTAGALGGKLLGAGGGGFLALLVPAEKRGAVRSAMKGCFEMPFRFEWSGARIVHAGERSLDEGFVR
jgi:D-glycero-alpha-D-manno-heptose-7-phosphate kinase